MLWTILFGLAILSLAMIPLESRWPGVPSQRRLRRGWLLAAGLTIIHVFCVLGFGVIAFTLNWTHLDNPAPPSLAGQGLSVVAGVLGFPLLTPSDFFLVRLPSNSWLSAILRSPFVFVANSVLWGFGGAMVWRRMRGKSYV